MSDTPVPILLVGNKTDLESRRVVEYAVAKVMMMLMMMMLMLMMMMRGRDHPVRLVGILPPHHFPGSGSIPGFTHEKKKSVCPKSFLLVTAVG